MRSIIVAIVIFASVLASSALQADITQTYGGTVYYVSAAHGVDDIGHDGRSWTGAKATIQAVLTKISADDLIPAEIWVSAETVTGDKTTDTYTGPITVPGGVSVFGGFGGYETKREDRNWAEHITVITGGITISTGVLDGFTVENANGCGVTCAAGTNGVVSRNVIRSVNVGIYSTSCATPVIMNNLIYDFDSCGITTYDSCPFMIDRNTIVGSGSSETGIQFGAPASPPADCEPTTVIMTGNIIAHCFAGVWLSMFPLEASRNDVWDVQVSDFSQLSFDPDFQDEVNHNYRLGVDSDCIDLIPWDGYCEDTDLDRNPRWADIANRGTDGDAGDLGAYEYPAPPLIDRGLPTSGANALTTAARTNIRWADSDPKIAYGGNFALPSGYWSIDKIRAWAIPTVPGYSSYFLGDHFSSITLYVSRTGSDLLLWKSGSLTAGSNVCSDPNIRITPVAPFDSHGYLRVDGGYDQVWQIDFLNVYWYETGGDKAFAVYGTPRVDRLWFNAASSVSGDSHLRRINLNTYTLDESTVSGACWFGGKPSDVNVQVFAHQAQ